MSNYMKLRNQRLRTERSGLPRLLDDFPHVQTGTSEHEVKKIHTSQVKSILPEYLTQIGRKSSIPSPFGVGYDLEREFN